MFILCGPVSVPVSDPPKVTLPIMMTSFVNNICVYIYMDA